MARGIEQRTALAGFSNLERVDENGAFEQLAAGYRQLRYYPFLVALGRTNAVRFASPPRWAAKLRTFASKL